MEVQTLPKYVIFLKEKNNNFLSHYVIFYAENGRGEAGGVQWPPFTEEDISGSFRPGFTHSTLDGRFTSATGHAVLQALAHPSHLFFFVSPTLPSSSLASVSLSTSVAFSKYFPPWLTLV